MAANTDDGALFLAKKFGGIALIILGILGIAVGLEYRSTELSIGLAVLGGIALVCGVGLLVLKKARVAGVYKGRPASIDIAKVRQLKAEGWGPAQIARKLDISRASVYRALES